MTQCAVVAERLLGRDGPAGSLGPRERARDEAARMAGLFARLAEGFGRGALLQARLPAAILDEYAQRLSVKPTPSAPAPKLHAAPGAARGRLKNGNPSGDYLKAPRCGAHTRAGGSCRQPAMANGRCRMHGGLSTGPCTPAGLARCRTTRLVHGCRTRAHITLRSRATHAARRLRALSRGLSAHVSAGHGVRRPESFTAGARGACPPFSPTASSPADSRLTDPRARAARPYSSRLTARVPAGHGVHRSDSISRKDAEAQSIRATPSSSFSAPSRLRVESTAHAGTLSAGHGVRRSFRDHLRSSAFIIPTMPMRNFVLPSAADPR